MGNTATDPQIKFINSLKEQFDPDDAASAEAIEALELGRTLWRAGAFDKAAASAVIDALKAAPRAESLPDPSKPGVTHTMRRNDAAVPEGMHKFDGVIYKVQKAVHGSGRPYAKELVRETHEGRCGGHLPDNFDLEELVDDEGRWVDPSAFDAPWFYCSDQATCTEWVEGETAVTFEYAPGAIRNLSEDTRLSLEEATQFGALYGSCVVCGRVLTNEESIEAGIGPVCAGKWF